MVCMQDIYILDISNVIKQLFIEIVWSIFNRCAIMGKIGGTFYYYRENLGYFLQLWGKYFIIAI